MKTTLSTQGHLTLTFPMKSPADCAAVRSHLQASTAELYQAADAMGTLHYCRFIALGDDTVCMLADFDGELESVLDDLPQHFGSGPGSLARARQRSAADACRQSCTGVRRSGRRLGASSRSSATRPLPAQRHSRSSRWPPRPGLSSTRLARNSFPFSSSCR